MAYSYETIKNILSYAVALSPDSAFPLDSRSYFGSLAEATAAANGAKPAGSSESVYFYGQQVYVVENDVVKTYLIQTDGSLSEVGSKTLGDDKTIVLDKESGKLSLKSFGVKYYKYVPADVVIDGTYSEVSELPSANTGDYALVGSKYYKYNGTDWEAVDDFTPKTQSEYVLTEGWKSGLEPKVVTAADGTGYELAWYEPSTTTVEGLSSVVSGVQTSVDNLNSAVEANKTDIEAKLAQEVADRKAADNILDGKITANTDAISVLNGDTETEGSVLWKINYVLEQLVGDGSQATIDSLTELVEWANEHATEVVEMNNAINKNKADIAALDTLVGDLPEGITSTTVVAYIAEAVEGEKTRAEAAEKAISNRVTVVEGKTANLGTAANENVEAFATAAQGAKADSAVQTVVAGTTNGHIAVDGNDVKVYELPVASITEAGGVKVDGSSITATEAGVISVNSVSSDKVTGLDTKLIATQTAAETTAKEYTDDNAVAKTSIVAQGDVAADVEAGSNEKVVSEKALIDMLTWKTIM